MKKYTLEFNTGQFIRTLNLDTIKEVKTEIGEIKNHFSKSIHVWDSKAKDFIYKKDFDEKEPSTDLIYTYKSDLRTTTKLIKGLQ